MLTPRFAAQDGAAGLVPHAHRMTLHGSPGSVDFPALCPHCGAPASRMIDYAKVFRRASSSSDTLTSYVMHSVAVPFCDDCIARHQSEERPLRWFETALSGFGTGDMLGATSFALIASFMAYQAMRGLLHGQTSALLPFTVLGLVFGAMAWFYGRSVWSDTAYLRVLPQSSVTEAFDFSDDDGPAFEPPRFQCTIRDARFAEAFGALHHGREWDPNSELARAGRRGARRQMWIIGGIVAAIGLAGLIHDWIK